MTLAKARPAAMMASAVSRGTRGAACAAQHSAAQRSTLTHTCMNSVFSACRRGRGARDSAGYASPLPCFSQAPCTGREPHGTACRCRPLPAPGKLTVLASCSMYRLHRQTRLALQTFMVRECGTVRAGPASRTDTLAMRYPLARRGCGHRVEGRQAMRNQGFRQALARRQALASVQLKCRYTARHTPQARDPHAAAASSRPQAAAAASLASAAVTCAPAASPPRPQR